MLGRILIGIGIGIAALATVFRKSNLMPTENQKFEHLEPSTRLFAQSLIEWAKSKGMKIRLGETYRSWQDQLKVDPSRTAIKPGEFGWHSVGRAFHLVITGPNGKLDEGAYKTVGEEARRRGGVWFGDRVLRSSSGKPFIDLAHFEYHPEWKSLSAYRGTPAAQQELALAEQRAKTVA